LVGRWLSGFWNDGEGNIDARCEAAVRRMMQGLMCEETREEKGDAF
jgi:hypothetical protein